MRDVLLIIIGMLGWFVIANANAQGGTLQECTAIAVPMSSNLPVRVNGALQKPPVEISQTFAESINTVQLPDGFQAIGGDSKVVIACTK